MEKSETRKGMGLVQVWSNTDENFNHSRIFCQRISDWSLFIPQAAWHQCIANLSHEVHSHNLSIRIEFYQADIVLEKTKDGGLKGKQKPNEKPEKTSDTTKTKDPKQIKKLSYSERWEWNLISYYLDPFSQHPFPHNNSYCVLTQKETQCYYCAVTRQDWLSSFWQSMPQRSSAFHSLNRDSHLCLFPCRQQTIMFEVCSSVITFETSIFISIVALVIALKAVGEVLMSI